MSAGAFGPDPAFDMEIVASNPDDPYGEGRETDEPESDLLDSLGTEDAADYPHRHPGADEQPAAARWQSALRANGNGCLLE
jgi:hypothetical protein